MRKARPYEKTCYCSAYRFPHRFCGGRCTGLWVSRKAWSNSCHGYDRPCISCNESNEGDCAVIDGRESPEQCDAWQEHVTANEIRIYKVNWK